MDNKNTIEQEWTEIIQPRNNLLKINFGEVWQYRDLLTMLVWRDFVTYFGYVL